ncbi:hypothetical protein BBP40_002227 [Aspergillus hancockii]|nr:hypothetical protein BBP40_002227 [Aspergillus hancockii]
MDSPTIPSWYHTSQESSGPSSTKSNDNPYLKTGRNPVSKVEISSSPQRNRVLLQGYVHSSSDNATSKSPVKPSVTAKEVRFKTGPPPPVPPKPLKPTSCTATKITGSMESRLPLNDPLTAESCCYVMRENGSKQATYRCRRQESLHQQRLVSDTGILSESRSQSGSLSNKLRSPSKDRTSFTVPLGITPSEASSTLSKTELEELRSHATSQAEKLKVLTKHEVTTLLQDLEAVDEHRKYLRNTYISLQSGRRVLHEQTIRYLGSPTLTAAKCREQMLVRERALMDLNVSIDEWAQKLEQATKKWVSIRQKLQEHISAILVVEGTNAVNPSAMQSTACTSRKTIQSIQIFAHSTLFADSLSN